ncbi:MAG: PAS domain S-box protein, partial [Deltaproteobacteria bacterium]|nr:PAS domain S-box protein [Deltaproteobacteria bacterium]
MKNVLVLNSYHQGFQWNDNLVKGIKAVLKPTDNISLHIESMDTKRIYTPEHLKNLLNLYQHKFRNIEFDLIITSDNNAFNFIRKHRNLLFPETPVVFFGVNDFKDEDIQGLDWITGMAETMDIKGTIDTALKLHPKANTIYVINDYTPTGIGMKKSIIESLKDWKDPPRMVFSKDVLMDDLLIDIEQLPQNTLIYLGAFFRDKTGQYFFPEETTQLIVEYSPVPVYTSIEILFRNGVVGGNLIEGYVEGEKAASIGKQIMDGTSPDRIPVVKPDKVRSIYDSNALTKWKVNAKLLPPDSVILNQPSSFYGEYKTLVWQVASVIAVLSAFILVLLMNIHKRKQAEGELKESNSLLSSIMDSPDNVIMFALDKGYNYLSFNKAHVKAMKYAYDADIEIGQHILSYIPNEDDRLKAEKNYIRVLKGERFIEIQEYGLLENRSWYELIFNPIVDISNQITGCTVFVTDISERKRAEEALQESEALLSMAGRTARFGGWSAHPDGHEVVWSEQVALIHEKQPGYSPTVEEAIQYYAPEWRDKIAAVFEICGREGTPWDEEMEIITAGGHRLWVRTTGEAVRDNMGKIVRVQGSFQDINEVKQAEETLRDVKRRNQALLDHSPVCHKIVDLDFNLTYMSTNGYKTYPFEFFPAAFRNEMTENLKKVKETGDMITMEALANDIEGNEVWLDSTLLPVLDDDGRIDYITVVSANTTQRK